MVQEFKAYDKKYAAFKGKLMDYETHADSGLDMDDAQGIQAWTIEVGKYSNAEIRAAVYFDKTAEEWQKFRVSQKGFDTRQKLYRLAYRLFYFENTEQYAIEKLRVDNYLGALVRGGQLSTDLKVQR